MKFEPKHLDFSLSPYTGLTRESWLEAAQYLLDGIFSHITDFNHPVIVPRQEKEITYPHLKAEPAKKTIQKSAEIFEGLARSFLIAAPLIKNKIAATSGGYHLKDYYKNHILRICTRGDVLYVGNYEDLQKTMDYADPDQSFQHTVETSALVIGLWICKEQIWDSYTKEEQDMIAEFLSGYAHANTGPSNWRLFNMLDMAFLNMMGYPIKKEIMLEHAQAVLNYYAGDGWYRDGTNFDYYSCWAFNTYAPIWNLWYGYENLPFIANVFELNSNKLMETYYDFFDRDGWTNMWGRSNIYRNASTSAFFGNLLLTNSTADPGLSRRLCSGSLMQFLGNENFRCQQIPTLGFYGPFMPLVQSYSCAESPFWLGKAFLCLYLPAEHPFWTTVENNGSWEKMNEKQVKVTYLDGPALCFSNHQANGETILRSGKVVKAAGNNREFWNYSKLCYNTKFPWEASPSSDVESLQYVFKDVTSEQISKANATFWYGEKKGILYRRQFFDYKAEQKCHTTQAMNLADFVVPYGIVRVDKLRLYKTPVEITLGAYGFPDHGTEMIEKNNGKAKAIILKGYDSRNCKKQLAMTIYDGWERLNVLYSHGTNPESADSIVLYASMKKDVRYNGYEPYVLISQIITKEDHGEFSEDEIFPIAKIIYTDEGGCGCYGPIVLIMKDGTEKEIEFEGIEGRLML